MREAIKVPREPKTVSAKAMWIAKSVVSCEARDRSLDSSSYEAKIVSNYMTISALHRVDRRQRQMCIRDSYFSFAGIRIKRSISSLA